MEELEKKSFLKKYSKHILIYLLFIFVAANFYLRHSKLLIYSNATNDVAMLNIKWGMSPTEISQVTNREFEDISSVDSKFKIIYQKLPIIDNANMSEIHYYFLNDQLFKIRIKKPIHSYSEQRVGQFIQRIGFNNKEQDIVSGHYAGKKYKIEQGKQKKSLYLGFDSSDQPKNTYVTMYYEPIARKFDI
jgi:hypothetical protein